MILKFYIVDAPVKTLYTIRIKIMGPVDNKQKDDEDNKAAWWQPAMLLGMQITGWIVGPILVGLLLGRWLDKKFGTEPWLLLVSMVLAFVITNVGIVKEGRRAQQKMEEKDKK